MQSWYSFFEKGAAYFGQKRRLATRTIEFQSVNSYDQYLRNLDLVEEKETPQGLNGDLYHCN